MRSNRNGEVSTFQDASGLYYSDNSNTSSDNICRVIVNAINSEEPARFVSAENRVTQSNQDCYRQAVPFVEGDVIQFSVMIHAQQDQHNLTGVPEIVGRTYNVSLNINTNPYSLNQVPTE
jgi:hypothetical protein